MSSDSFFHYLQYFERILNHTNEEVEQLYLTVILRMQIGSPDTEAGKEKN
jgi:hypothetical protein